MVPTKRLWTVIDTSIKEKNIHTLNQYLSSTDSSEALNATTLNYLANILKNNGKPEDKILDVDVVLSCLDHFINKNIIPEKWQINASSLGRVCELAFAIAISFIKEEDLVIKVANIFTNIVNQRKVVADELLKFTLNNLLKVVITGDYSSTVKHIVLRTTSCMLTQSSRELRREIIPTRISLLNKLSNNLVSCGDYEMQVGIVEILARCWSYINGADLFTDCPKVLNMFKACSFSNLDSECRKFLNDLNNGLGGDQLVYSIPCVVLTIDGVRYRKPADSVYQEFWVDFNIGSRSLSFYYQNHPDELWELMTICDNKVTSISAVNSMCKGKSGSVISVVKMEVTFKEDSEEVKVLKVYFKKGGDYEKLEQRVFNKIFMDKFKSAVTYEKLNVTQTQPSSKLEPSEQSSKLLKPSESQVETPDLSTTAMSQSIHDPEQTILQGHKNDSSSSGSDSFSKYIKELKKQESKITVRSQEVNVTNTSPDDQNEDLAGIQPLEHFKTCSNTSGRQKRKVSNEPEKMISNPNLNTEFQEPTTPTLNTYESKEKVKESAKSKSLPDSKNNSSDIKRRRLFSSESHSIKDFVLSSQEDFSAEIPQYKLQKKEEPKTKPLPNVNRKNITFSYINDKAKQNSNMKEKSSPGSSGSKDVFTKLRENDCNEINKKNNQIIPLSPQSPDADKKSSGINKLIDIENKSSIFTPELTSFLSPKKDTHLKKTYARAKPRNRRQKIEMHFESSDSDYLPPANLSQVEPRKKAQRKPKHTEELLDSVERFCGLYVDPIRDVGLENVDDEILIKPITLKEDEEKREIGEIKALSPLSLELNFPSNNRKRKVKSSEVKDNASKKRAPQVQKKKLAQPKKQRAKKNSAVLGNPNEKSALKKRSTSASPITGLELQPYNEVEEIKGYLENPGEGFAVEASGTKISQDSDMPSRDMFMMFGQHILSETNKQLQTAQALSKKERDIHYSTHVLQCKKCTSLTQQLKQKQMAFINNSLKIKSLLEANSQLQMEIFRDFEHQSKNLEAASETLQSNISVVDETEKSQFGSIFQNLKTYLGNFATSFLQRNTLKKE